jgi:phosphate transport system permease protein
MTAARFSQSLYASRRRRNMLASGLAIGATSIGLAFLALVLGFLLWKGAAGLGTAVFLETTPAPGSSGGLSNAIAGSNAMTIMAMLIGTPLGIFAGTYMAEFGRGTKLTWIIRYINDILLSAPSIVIGLFVYEIAVKPSGHFSAWAGSIALALIVIPVVVRTTEDMLLMVPHPLREAAFAVGAPRSVVVRAVAYRAARAGIMTGVLLALARISGETAPLLFTALNNQFWSLDLNAPITSLPVVIFQFAMSPYADWQQLAWTGSLLIAIAVLAMNIIARLLLARGQPST